MNCHVCGRLVASDVRGEVQHEAVARREDKHVVWGPVVVHDDCRLDVVTPYDDTPWTYLMGYRARPEDAS
jgi:hypothetical protein